MPFARIAHLSLFALLAVAPGGRVHAQTYAVSTVAGAAGDRGPVDGAGAAARFSISKLAIDRSGNVVFADSVAHTIRQVSPAGLVTTYAGVPGQPGGADGPLASARFFSPTAVAFDAAGNLYVADNGNRLLRKITAAGVVSTLAGRLGRTGTVDGTGAVAEFDAITALAVDPAGNVYAAESVGIRVAIRRASPAGVVTTIWRPVTGTNGTTEGFHVNGLACDRAGNLFVADWSGNTIRRITPAGEISIVAGAVGKIGADDGTGTAAAFNGPADLATDANGDLIVADAGYATLRRVTPAGRVTTIVGQPDALPRGTLADGLGGGARLAYPIAVAVDPTGNICFADSSGTVLRKAAPIAAPAPPILTRFPTAGYSYNRNVGARAAVTFDSAATGSTPLAFQWLKDGMPLPGATNSALTISSAAATDEGRYAVTVSNAAGAHTSQSVSLRVFTPAFDGFALRRTVAGGSFLWGIASGGGQLVVVGDRGTILTSLDGQSWTTRGSGTTDWLVGVTYGAGQFVAVGDHGLILVSRDGATWTRAAASGTTQRLNNVAFGANRFVAVGEGGAIVTSPDAQTWTAAASGVTTWLRGLVYVPVVTQSPHLNGDNGTGRFYVAGQNGVVLENTGTQWSRAPTFSPTTASTRDIEALADGPTGIGQDGLLTAQYSSTIYSKGYFTFPDGYYGPAGYTFRNWSYFELGLAARFRGLARGAGAIFATGENGTIAAAQDISGPWSFIPSGTTANLVNAAFHGNALFVVGENETILQSQELYPSRLINIATRGQIGTGANVMISGFVVSGSAPKTILLRAAGPALRAFGLTDVLAAPVLTLFDGASRPLATNRGWSTSVDAAAIASAAARLGAFPFAGSSADAALLITLPPGAYTAQVTGVDGTGGLALVEAYDAEPAATNTSRTINLSTRGHVGAADLRLIAGFVINGAASRRVLIRAVGPSLAPFGLTGVLAQPQLELFDDRGSLLQRVGAWSAQPNADALRSAAITAGAFALQDDGADAALVTTLLPGSYTVQVSGLNGTTGLAIVEVYDLP